MTGNHALNIIAFRSLNDALGSDRYSTPNLSKNKEDITLTGDLGIEWVARCRLVDHQKLCCRRSNGATPAHQLNNLETRT